MHTIWKGSISFGLVHIPVKLFAATENKNVSFRQLHEKCHTPIKYEKVCPSCETEVSQEDIVKGYEYEKGKFVILNEEELDVLAQKKNKHIEIVDFIKLEEIDPIYFNRSYYLGPHEHGEKAYSLLQKAMQDSQKVAIAKIMLRAKEHLAAIRVYEQALVLETIHYPDEVRHAENIPGLRDDIQISDKEMEMALQLVEQLTTTFDPEKYTDEYRERVKELVQNKVSGNEVKIAPEVPQTDITNLMEALQQSINETKSQKKQTRKRKTSKTKKKATG